MNATSPAPKVLLLANTDWYLYNFRRALANALEDCGVDVVLVCPPGRFVPLLEMAGFRVRCFPLERRSVAPWSQWQPVAALASIYKEERPDLVHHFTVKCVLLGSLAARLARVPAIVNAVAGLGFVFSSSAAYARLLRPAVEAALRLALSGERQRLIVQNEVDRDLLVGRRLVDARRARLIRGSGVNVRRFRPASGPARRRGALRVLLATRLLWDKGVGLFAEAARELSRVDPEIEFLIAGTDDPGNPNSVPGDVIDSWDREGLVDFLGHVDDMPGLLRNVDVLCLPTAYGEGVPRILIEAAASGLPLVASDSPGCRDIVRDGVNGLLIPPAHDEVAPLVYALRQLHANPDLRQAMGAAGRKLAIAGFDEDRVIDATLAVYRELRPDETRFRKIGAAGRYADSKSEKETPVSIGVEVVSGKTMSPVPGSAQSHVL